MTEHLAQRLVNHRHVGLTPKAISKFPFHHTESGLDIATLVVVLQELSALEHEVVVHLAPLSPTVASVMGREGDEGDGSHAGDSFHVLSSRVPLVSGNLRDAKVVCCRIDHRRQQRRIVRIPVVNLDSRHDVCFDPAHEMALNPIVLFPHLPVLVVKPAGEARCGKAGRIHSKINLYRLERQTTLRDESFKNRRHAGILKVVEDRVIVRGLGDKSFALCVPKIGHKASPGNSRIDLECRAKYGIGQGQTRATGFANMRLRDGTAQVVKQRLEFVFLVRLGGVVRRPVLRVGRGLLRDREVFRNRCSAVRVFFPRRDIGHSVDVLAHHPAKFIIWTGTRRRLMPDVDNVSSLASLRRNNPTCSGVANSSSLGKLDASLLSGFHHFATLIMLLQCSYNVARCQEESARTFFLTRSYMAATLWHMAKSKKKAATKSLKDEVVRFRVSAEQKQAFEEAAQRDGLDVSAWIRRVALKEAGALPEAK